MTEPKYKSLYTPRVGDFGKFILYSNKEGDIVFATRMASVTTSPELTLENIEGMIKRGGDILQQVGIHRDIVMSLTDLVDVFGGAFFTVPTENKVNVFGQSRYYGEVVDEDVQKCFGPKIQVTRLR